MKPWKFAPTLFQDRWIQKSKSENLKIQLKSLKPTYNPLKSTFSDFAKNFHLDYFNDAESENQGPEI